MAQSFRLVGDVGVAALAENGTINNYASGGWNISQSNNLRIDQTSGKLTVNYAVILDGYRDEQNPWFYATTDYYNEETYETDYSKLAHITEVQAEELLAGMPDAADYALTSFEDYVQRSGAVSGDPPAGQSLVLDTYFD